MTNLNELICAYLRLFGEIQRNVGDDLDRRSIQYYLNELASAVESEDIEVLHNLYEELCDWAGDLELV